ncbi:MAG: hypothetical protein ABR529_10365 [Actinomycetota bacterium]
MTTKYGRAALDGEVERVRSAAEGVRNGTLNAAAYRLGRLVAAGEVEEHDAEASLLDAALATGLQRREVRPTIRSGIRAGRKRPAEPRSRPLSPPPPPPVFRLREAMRPLLGSATFPVTWALAKEMAQLPPAVWKADVLSAWDALADRLDIPALVSTVELLQQVAEARGVSPAALVEEL